MTIIDKLHHSCAKQTTMAIIYNKGRHFIGTNWCRKPQQACPRKNMPTGVGYERCRNICQQVAHAEVDACTEAGEYAMGGTLILIGHSYCCENCKRIMSNFGIKEVIILGGSI